MRKFFVLTAVTMTFILGCGNDGTETGNALDVVFDAVSSQDPQGTTLPAVDAQGTDMVVETARASVRRIDFEMPAPFDCTSREFDAPVTCDDTDGEFRVHGPYIVDLVNMTSTPILRGLTIPQLPYDRVDVRLQQSDALDDLLEPTDPLIANTLHVTGTIDYQASPITFDLLLDFSEDARFDGSDVDAATVLLQLDVVQWFAAAPLTQCLDDGDLVINAGNVTIQDGGVGGCSAIENDLKDAIRDSGTLLAGP